MGSKKADLTKDSRSFRRSKALYQSILTRLQKYMFPENPGIVNEFTINRNSEVDENVLL